MLLPDTRQRLRLKDFRLLLNVSESGQLGIAAEQMGMTQPAASRMLAHIEQIVGGKVFNRHPKGMSVTPMGEILARHAANLLQGVEETERELQGARSGFAGTARVGAVTGAAVSLVVPAIQHLKRSARGADLHIEVAPSDVLIDGLLRGTFDFVLARIPAGVEARQFEILWGNQEPSVFVARSGHSLAKRRHLKIEHLQGYEWVIQGPQTPLRLAVEEAFIERGVPLPAEIVNTASTVLTIAYLLASNGIAPMSREVAAMLAPSNAESGLRVLDVSDPLFIRPYHLVALKNRAIAPLAVNLKKLVAEAMQKTSAS